MTDTLETSLSTSPHHNNDNTNPSSTIDNNKRNATEEISENIQTKVRRTSTIPADEHISTNAPTDITCANDNRNASQKNIAEGNNNIAGIDSSNTNSSSSSTTADAAVARTTSTNPSTNIPQDTLLRGSNPSTAAAVLSSFLADPQQQQHFLQTYAQASGQDLTQLTASSLAQAMVSPISVPGFNLLQQLQAGNIITALPGPPGSLSLNGSQSQQQQQQQQQSAHQPSSHSVPIKTEDPTNGTGDIAKSSTLDVQVNDMKRESNDNDTPGLPMPPSISTAPSTSPDATAAAATAAAAAAAAAAARNLSNDERRQRRLLRNRVAAKECRKKKKQYILDMEDKITRLEEENALLQRQLDDAKNKLAFSTMQGPESYRLMKEVEELNAKLGMGQQLSTTTTTSGTTTTTTDSSVIGTTAAVEQPASATTDASSNSGLDAVISVIASIQQRHEQQQQQQMTTISSPTSSLSTCAHIPSTIIPTEKDYTIASETTTTTTATPVSPSVSPSTDISTTLSASLPAPINGSSSPVPGSTSSASSTKADIGTVDQHKSEVNME